MLSQKIFKIRMLKLGENEFHTTKFPDFSSFVFFFEKSLTFLFASKLPDISRFSGHPANVDKTSFFLLFE